MRSHLRIAFFASALVASLVIVVPPAEAGGSFGMHIGSGGFGVSVGFGDWGPYTNSWTNPHWSLDFNVALSGYGEWVWAGDLGRVWRPWVAVGWRPYTYGRWVSTSLGWTWVAYEPWGFVPHHYGSWAFCDFGWVWVPGYSYSCANVVWVRSGGYVGWYARPPRGWSHAARGYRNGYRDGYRDGWNDARYATYVDWHHMSSDNVSHYAVRHTVATRGRVENHGPPPTADEIRRRGGISVTDVPVSQRTITMNGRQVSIARPDGVAGSIERHASRTAAEALSPTALERRQPQVRSRPSEATAREPHARSVRTHEGQSGPPDRTERRRQPASNIAPMDDHETTGTGTSATGARHTRSAGASPEVWTRDGRSLKPDRSDPVRRPSVSVDSGNHRESTPGTRLEATGSTRRPENLRPTAGGTSAEPGTGRSGSTTKGHTARSTGAASASRPPAVRTTPKAGRSPESGNGVRRQKAPRGDRDTETTEKKPERPPKAQRR